MATRRTTRDIPSLTLRASFRPESLDEEKRTVDLVWSTGARVVRGFFDRFLEELSLEEGHVRMERLNSGAPLLDAHNGRSTLGVVGVVEAARVEDGEGVATVRFPRAEDDAAADRVFRLVADRILRNVSVGYAVHRYEKTGEEENDIPVRRAVDWEPFELSIVPVGADARASVRAAGAETNPCEFVEDVPQEEQRDMGKKHNDPQGGAPAAPVAEDHTEERSAPIDEAAIRAEAALAERTRCEEIRGMARSLGLGEDIAGKLIERGISVDEARKEAIDLHAEKERASAPSEQLSSQQRVDVGDDLARKGAADGLRNALLHRGDPGRNELEEVGRPYRGLSLLEGARRYLDAHGVKTVGLGKRELAAVALGLEVRGGMHSTSDFPLILADVMGKTLRRAYDEAPQTFQPWARRTTLPDFREVKRTQLGEAPQLVKVPEGAEFTRGTIGEGREVYSLATYGRVFAVTRQTLINDDLDALTRLPMLFGRSARDLESDLVYDHLTSNPTMGDSVVLFHDDHGNVGNGSISVDNIGEGRKMMRLQVGLDGKQRITVIPRFLLVPVALETHAEKFVADIRPEQAGNVNPFVGRFQVIAEPRLDADDPDAWYLIADPAQIDTLEYGYLEGEEGVAIESRVGFDVDGLEIKARLDFGCKAIDWRGFYQSDGDDNP